MAATNIPYVFTGVEGFPDDLVAKAAKAQWYANHEGMAYGKLLISCPLNWRTDDRVGVDIVQAAVDSCFFPLYEVERGHTSDHLRPGGGRAAHPGRLLAEAHGQDPPPVPARERGRPRVDRGRDRAPLAAAARVERAPTPVTATMNIETTATILQKRKLTDVTTLFVVAAPLVALNAAPGQFVILRVNEVGERVPISLTDFDRRAGTITLVVQVVGKTSALISALEEGDDDPRSRRAARPPRRVAARRPFRARRRRVRRGGDLPTRP